MKKYQDYEINFTTNTITVTKQFLAAASIIDSEAYQTMMKLRDLGMVIHARQIRRGPCKEKRWNYERMQRYLEQVDDDKYLEHYQILRKTMTYMSIWTWFKKTFPNRYQIELNGDNRIIVTPADYCIDNGAA